MHKECLSITENYVYYVKVANIPAVIIIVIIIIFVMHVFGKTCHKAYASAKTREVTVAYIQYVRGY